MKGINIEQAKISDKIHKWSEDYHTGYFVLHGDNPLMKNSLWIRMQRVASDEGKGVVVRKDGPSNEKDRFLLGLLKDVEHDVLEESNPGVPLKKAKVSYIDREGNEDFSEDLLDENEPEDYVIFGNNDKWEPNLQGNETQHKYLDCIYRAMIFDLECSRPHFVIKSRTSLGEEKKKTIRRMWEAYNVVVFFSLDDSQPIEPYNTDAWNPDSKFDKYERMWNLSFSLYRRLNGIRHNTSKKEERHNTKEMMLVEDQFENPENIRLQERIETIKECYEKFQGEKNGHWYELLVDGKVVFSIGVKPEETNQKPKNFFKKDKKVKPEETT